MEVEKCGVSSRGISTRYDSMVLYVTFNITHFDLLRKVQVAIGVGMSWQMEPCGVVNIHNLSAFLS